MIPTHTPPLFSVLFVIDFSVLSNVMMHAYGVPAAVVRFTCDEVDFASMSLNEFVRANQLGRVERVWQNSIKTLEANDIFTVEDLVRPCSVVLCHMLCHGRLYWGLWPQTVLETN